MSHIVTITPKIHDARTVAVVCERMGLAAPTWGSAQLFSGNASGLLVQFPGWTYPAVIETLTGTVRFDNFEGRWGEGQHLDKFLQLYAVEKAKVEARRQGHSVSEQTLTNGSIKVQILTAS